MPHKTRSPSSGAAPHWEPKHLSLCIYFIISVEQSHIKTIITLRPRTQCCASVCACFQFLIFFIILPIQSYFGQCAPDAAPESCVSHRWGSRQRLVCVGVRAPPATAVRFPRLSDMQQRSQTHTAEHGGRDSAYQSGR